MRPGRTPMQDLGREGHAVNSTAAAPEGACEPWGDPRHVLLQAANLCLAGAFVVPTQRAAGITRILLAMAFLLASVWSVLYSCAGPDVLAWNATLFAANCAQAAYMAYRKWPPNISPELQEFYVRVFAPIKVGKDHFRQLVRIGDIETLDLNESYAMEGVTAADERLSVLLAGKIKVTCEDVLLHYLLPTEFVDSPEWQSCATNTDKRFQVTLTAIEPCRLLCWRRRDLLSVLSANRFLGNVMDNLIGKDITHKLYSLNDPQLPPRMTSSLADTLDWWRSPPLPRSQSEDFIRTGSKGRVRSSFWRRKLESRRASQIDNLGSSDACNGSDPGPLRTQENRKHFTFSKQQNETPV